MALNLELQDEQPRAVEEKPAAQHSARPGLTYRVDVQGRRLGLRALDALTKFRIRRIAGPQDSNNFAAMIDYYTAAVVAEIDGRPENPPRSLQQIEAMISQLGNDGMETVGLFVLEQIGITQETLEQAKNSQPTLS